MTGSRRVLVTGGAGFVGATLARQVLGFAPGISREDGIRQTGGGSRSRSSPPK